MVYLENRQYLPPDSILRRQAHGFPTNGEDNEPPPTKKRFSDIKKQHRAYENELLRYMYICACGICAWHAYSCSYIT